jgi:hypothetical protein
MERQISIYYITKRVPDKQTFLAYNDQIPALEGAGVGFGLCRVQNTRVNVAKGRRMGSGGDEGTKRRRD